MKQKCNFCDKVAKYYIKNKTIQEFSLYESGKKEDNFLDNWDTVDDDFSDEYWCEKCAEEEDLI